MSGLAATLSLARPPTRRAMTHHAQSLLASHAVPGGIHHSVVVVRDLEASLRFYRDGIGLDLLQDRHVEGDWPDLFDAPSRRLRGLPRRRASSGRPRRCLGAQRA